MIDKLNNAEKRLEEINESLTDMDIINDQNKYKALMKEHKQLTPIVDTFRRYKKSKEEFEEAADWFHRAGYDCESEIDVASSGTSAFMALALCFRKLTKSPKIRALPQWEYELECARLTGKAAEYEQLARDWKPVEPRLITN